MMTFKGFTQTVIEFLTEPLHGIFANITCERRDLLIGGKSKNGMEFIFKVVCTALIPNESNHTDVIIMRGNEDIINKVLTLINRRLGR